MNDLPPPDRPLQPARSVGSDRYRRALAFLYDRINYERGGGHQDYQFRLKRTAELFRRLGLGGYLHPEGNAATGHPKVPLVHIAGTKGKGSTATMVSAILTAAGYRVGLYTSPHLTDLEERFRIDGEPCSPDCLIDLVRSVAPVVESMDSQGDADESAGGMLSFFELTTAMAVYHFDRSGCDVIVLEVGLGGRLDSTNVCASSVAAITSIGLDHQRVLGETIAEIAGEKAGIIKSAAPVVSGAITAEAADVIAAAADRNGAPLFQRDRDFFASHELPLEQGSRFEFRAAAEELRAAAADDDRLIVDVRLDGRHQVENASLAIAMVRLLQETFSVDDQAIRRGLRHVQCIGRMERFEVPPGVQVVVDTAHNPDSMRALKRTLQRRRAVEEGSPGKLRGPVVGVVAISRDKDAAAMIDEMEGAFDQILCTQFTTNPRSLSAQQLTSIWRGRRPEIEIQCQADPAVALAEAVRLAAIGGTVVVCGSFFLAGQLRPELERLAATADAPTLVATRCQTDVDCSTTDSP
ncbi:bifunctional folylpolyglutamate synthase/dihydrofolate synthase [Roseiconus nitratireducens]|uniref:Dihydrofolate synthase/folylpolyglutamate synthase n=1 Tax=Roseiconus nitratireducens TaxID=2605748 RepID=A0A5M6DL86_9BACT|nr:folylpolyglutamate synthase/dihydrofolate synthase family protein [Roseiconus nitratireducens]KAA5547166.1 bifunctional folylpolyglutamate synthase/dihydrofolate synthase [Roseiconus nitratireducens]